MGAPRALLALPGVWELLAERTPGEGLHGEGFAGVPAVRVLTRYAPWAYRGVGTQREHGDNVQRVKSRVWSVLTYLLTYLPAREDARERPPATLSSSALVSDMHVSSASGSGSCEEV